MPQTMPSTTEYFLVPFYPKFIILHLTLLVVSLFFLAIVATNLSDTNNLPSAFSVIDNSGH